jgi:hypothetical protein
MCQLNGRGKRRSPALRCDDQPTASVVARAQRERQCHCGIVSKAVAPGRRIIQRRQSLGSRPASAGRIGRDCRVRLRVGASRPVKCPLSGFCSSGKGRPRRPGTCSQRTSWRSCGALRACPGLSWSGSSRSFPTAETFAWKIRGRDNVLDGSTLLDAAGCAVPPTPAMDDPRSAIEPAERSFPRAISEGGQIDTSRA